MTHMSRFLFEGFMPDDDRSAWDGITMDNFLFIRTARKSADTSSKRCHS